MRAVEDQMELDLVVKGLGRGSEEEEVQMAEVDVELELELLNHYWQKSRPHTGCRLGYIEVGSAGW